jgi:hypothetical protein
VGKLISCLKIKLAVMTKTGYSGTTLAKKLGIKKGYSIRLVNQPAYYFDLFTDLPENLNILSDKKTRKDLVHYFTKEIGLLQKEIATLRNEIFPNGTIWISWPKKTAKVKTNVTEDIIRKLALSNGLVDVKVCAVDEIWSGLKLVIPLKDRNASR